MLTELLRLIFFFQWLEGKTAELEFAQETGSV